MKIQWYPGHMMKAKRQMLEDLKLIDLVIELLDARAVMSSRNPEIDQFANGKARLVLLNKADLADDRVSAKWVEYFKEKNIPVVLLNSKDKSSKKRIETEVMEACKEKIERNKRRGILNRPVRAMVVGIPNVGKSTFINMYAGKAAAKTGNKPGVTKGKQWIRMGKMLELLDTPGILWPKFDDEMVGEHLAFIGSINDEIISIADLALAFLTDIKGRYRNLLESRYGVSLEEDNTKEDAVKDLYKIAKARNCLKSKDNYDYEKAARIIFDDFRNDRLGKISLEEPTLEKEGEGLGEE